MIATKTTTLLVTMAILGIVPIAAHAQQAVNLEALVDQSGTAAQTSDPAQATIATNNDQDSNTNTNTNTPINFAIVTVGPFSSATSNPVLTSPNTFTASDTDTNLMNQDEELASTPSNILAPLLTLSQNPNFPVSSESETTADIIPGTVG